MFYSGLLLQGDILKYCCDLMRKKNRVGLILALNIVSSDVFSLMPKLATPSFNLIENDVKSKI
jgi:hypothetical protein